MQLLSNTFSRIASNCTLELQAVDEMAEFAGLVRCRANYSKSKVERAWRGLADQPGHLQFCERHAARFRDRMTEASIK